MEKFLVDIKGLNVEIVEGTNDGSCYISCARVEDILIDLQCTRASQLSKKLHKYQLQIEDLMEENQPNKK